MIAWITKAARGIFFDNSINGFTSDNVQQAIEESKQYSVGSGPTICFTHNSTLGSGDYLRFSELMANVRIVFAAPTKLEEIAWNNNNTSLGEFTLKFYKNGSTLLYTYTPSSTDRTRGFGSHTFESTVSFVKDDYMTILYTKPTGTSLSDADGYILTSRVAS